MIKGSEVRKAEEDAESGESGGNDVEDAREAPAVAAREPSEDSEDEETTEEVEQREREEESERQAVSRRVFGTESNTQAMTVTRSLLMFAAFCVALAAWPKIIGLLCSYFEPLDTAVTAFEALTSRYAISPRWPRQACIKSPVSVDQIFTRWSSEPVTTRRPVLSKMMQ